MIDFFKRKKLRGAGVMQEGLFSFKRLDEFVPEQHHLREIRTIINAALGQLITKFDEMYAPTGRDSIASKKYQASRTGTKRPHLLPD